MVINEKGLCSAMKDAFKKRSTGYKVAALRLSFLKIKKKATPNR